MQQLFYFLLNLHRNFLPKHSNEIIFDEKKIIFTCSSHKVIDILVSSSINVISRRFESLFDVRLVNGIASEHVSIIPITSLFNKNNIEKKKDF